MDQLRVTYCPECRARVLVDPNGATDACPRCQTALEETLAQPAKRFQRPAEAPHQPEPRIVH